MTETRITVANGKYGVILRDDGPSSGLRLGRNTGLPTNREYALACEVRDLRAKIERMQINLNGRDDFIVSRGLWSDFVEQLPPTTAPTESQS